MLRPRFAPLSDRPATQTFGDVLHELGQLDHRALKDLEFLARWKLQMLKVEPPPLRGKDYLLAGKRGR